jgi:hypothetical protein
MTQDCAIEPFLVRLCWKPLALRSSKRPDILQIDNAYSWHSRVPSRLKSRLGACRASNKLTLRNQLTTDAFCKKPHQRSGGWFASDFRHIRFR